MKLRCLFIVVVFSLLLPFYAHAKLPDEAFSQLRSDISRAAGQSPIDGISKVDKALAEHPTTLAKSQTIRLLYLKSWYQINADRIEEAMSTLAQARLLARDIDEPGILYSYYSISASAFSNAQLYELALEYNLKAYQEAPLLGRPEFIYQTENNIGHVYLKLGLLDEAEHYFQRFYDSAVKENLISQQGTGLNNLGEVAFLKGDIDKALALHEKALDIRQKNNFKYHESWSLYNLGRVYSDKKLYEQAELHLKQAIDNWQVQNAHSKALKPKLELAKSYSEQARDNDAVNMLEEVVLLGKQHQQFSTLQEALMLKSQLKRKTGDLHGALEALDQYSGVAKKFADKQASIGLAYMVSQTKLRTKEMELAQLEQAHQVTLAKAESERRQAWLILLSASLIIVLTWFFMFRLNQRKRQLQTLLDELQSTQEKLVESEKMRAMTTLVSGMAHQLNTPLGLVITADSTLQSLVEKLAAQFNKRTLTPEQLGMFINESTELLKLSQKNSEKAADMIQRFKMMSAKLQMSELTTFSPVLFLKENIKSLTSTLALPVKFEICGNKLEITSYAPVLLKVITQLVENSVKHGFANTEKPRVTIKVEEDDTQHVLIHYIDNGEGIDKDKRKIIFDPFYTTRMGEGNLGLGLNIIYNSVVHILQGSVECIDDVEGAHFIIHIPKTLHHQ